jgi:hypothetical protein
MKGEYRVVQDMITPQCTADPSINLFDRPFTRLGPFASTVQAVYFIGLVNEHIQSFNRTPEQHEEDKIQLDTALHSFSVTLIPPPGKSRGKYCGAFALRTLLVDLPFFRFSFAYLSMLTRPGHSAQLHTFTYMS